jgi:hypothetical protein
MSSGVRTNDHTATIVGIFLFVSLLAVGLFASYIIVS